MRRISFVQSYLPFKLFVAIVLYEVKKTQSNLLSTPILGFLSPGPSISMQSSHLDGSSGAGLAVSSAVDHPIHRLHQHPLESS
jgi:hypothetical protein